MTQAVLQGNPNIRLPAAGAMITISPGQHVLGLGPWTHVERHPVGLCAFYAPDFFLSDKQPWKIPTAAYLFNDAQLARWGASWSAEKPKVHWIQPNIDAFRKMMHSLQCRISAGELRKAVPVVFEEGGIEGPALLPWFLQTLTRPLAADLLRYGIWDGHAGMLGATPEILFRRNHPQILRSIALAGTSSGNGEDLLVDAKQVYEHQCVAEDVVMQLGQIGTVTVGQMQVMRLPNMAHLCTEISAQIQAGVSFEDIVRLLHPTPALGTAPRDAQMQWLREQDTDVQRGRFGAPFGVVLPDGRETCLVAIRQVQWSSGAIRIGAGCGIVAQSDPQKEWDELGWKRESVKRLFAI